ncbi:hypothetical protein [Marinoscillum furvescens]|uniref:Uncharacterized protein n=1 Tax=Marinoscillum furvescens DSM 4134 TaxID=1122208 RepID=A0A3D9L3N0_MARFU|nr:hypothetical protein [Marinoscillum furvescens]RED97893.1 hypothetical protein C7460_11134 [Marinoscillum furvescens DSM 4134]
MSQRIQLGVTSLAILLTLTACESPKTKKLEQELTNAQVTIDSLTIELDKAKKQIQEWKSLAEFQNALRLKSKDSVADRRR